MGEHEAPAKRWVIVKLLQHAVERTEAEIEELKSGQLFVRDASGPDDTHVAPAAPPPPPVTVPAGSPPPGAKPDDTKEP